MPSKFDQSWQIQMLADFFFENKVWQFWESDLAKVWQSLHLTITMSRFLIYSLVRCRSWWRQPGPRRPRPGRARSRAPSGRCPMHFSKMHFRKCIFENAFFENFANFWRARSRLYQNEILQENMRSTAFFKLYKICILLHRCNLKIFAKNRFEKTAIFVKFQQKKCRCREICKILSNFKIFS